MSTIPRFVLDDKCNVIDVLNLSNPKGRCNEEEPKTQTNLREKILRVRLSNLVDDLIKISPETRNVLAEKHCPSGALRHSIWWPLVSVVRATPLHNLDPAVSLEKRFSGELNNKREGLQAFTSLSLFTADVERLLRDLYGDTPEVDPVVYAVSTLVVEILRYSQPDLWREHEDAADCDYVWGGVGRPEGYGISGSAHGRAMQGADNLRLRVRKVMESPSSFGKYTVEFAAKHVGNFIRLEQSRGDEVIDDLPF